MWSSAEWYNGEFRSWHCWVFQPAQYSIDAIGGKFFDKPRLEDICILQTQFHPFFLGGGGGGGVDRGVEVEGGGDIYMDTENE